MLVERCSKLWNLLWGTQGNASARCLIGTITRALTGRTPRSRTADRAPAESGFPSSYVKHRRPGSSSRELFGAVSVGRDLDHQAAVNARSPPVSPPF